MMNFKNLERFTNYTSYQRIQKIKHQQCTKGLSGDRCAYKSYSDYLNKKDGLVCCPAGNKKVNCVYTGALGKSECITSTLTVVDIGEINIVKIACPPPIITQQANGFIGPEYFGPENAVGALLPTPIWNGVSLAFLAGPPPGPGLAFWQVALVGPRVAGVVFDCIELERGQTKITLSYESRLSDQTDDDARIFTWKLPARLPVGTWTLRLCHCYC